MDSNNYIFKAPVGTRLDRGVIIPVFLPFAGCPFQCIYCLQDKQTGVGQISISDALQKLENDVKSFVEKNLALSNAMDKIEIAFYGGTFTALQENDLLLCLDVFKKIKEQLTPLNIKVFGRCSTRPDCLGFDDISCENYLKDDSMGKKENKTSENNRVSENNKISYNANLMRLKDAGIDLIELGIQSFDTKALIRIGRGYSSYVAKAACQYIKDQGFELGIQLMPGIPNQSVETFHSDVNIALAYKPSCMRYYPCLVPEGTGLARLWRAGEFVSWDLKTCLDALGYALHRAWQGEIPIIRLSIAPELAFDTQILAGVRHPALGSLIQARALLYTFEEARKQLGFETMNDAKSCNLEFHVPKNFQGFIFGEKNSLKEIWGNLVGLDNIIFDADDFEKGLDLKSIIFDAEGFEARANADSFTTKFTFLCKKKE